MAAIERVILSHWHSDHSGGLLAFLRYRNSIICSSNEDAVRSIRVSEQDYSLSIVVDLHPDRPIARGIAPPPTHDKVIGRLPSDPSFEEIEREGAKVETHAQGHTACNNTIFVSGEIPRKTAFEQGLPGGMRWIEHEGKGNARWTPEPVGEPSLIAVACL